MIFVSASQFYVYLPYLNAHFNKVKAFSGHCENFTKPSLTALSPSGSCWFANQPSGGTQQNAAAYKRYEGSYSCYDEEDWRRYWALCSLVTPPASLALLGACPHSHLGGWPE